MGKGKYSKQEQVVGVHVLEVHYMHGNVIMKILTLHLVHANEN